MKYFYTKDHLGSIREVLGANGTVVSSSRYDAWGVRKTQGAQDAASFGFTGHLEHKELGLVFTLYRAYDPATGRWLSRDPIGEEGGINLYGYVSNNPVNWIDPLGLQAVTGVVGLTPEQRRDLLHGGDQEAMDAFDCEAKELIEGASDAAKDGILAPIPGGNIVGRIIKNIIGRIWKHNDPGEQFPE